MSGFFNFLVDKSKFFIFFIIILSVVSLIGLPRFQLDASSDTLLLDNDPDLKIYRENSRKYGSSDFLVIAFTPKAEIFNLETITLLKELVKDLNDIKGIKNVLSLFDVPLLQYSDQSISELADNVITLSTDNVDLSKAKYEFETNEVYRGLLISDDLKTIAFQMSLEPNSLYQNIISERYDLLDQKVLLKKEEYLSSLERIDQEIEKQKKINLSNEANLIKEVRNVTSRYSNQGEIFLGGGAMIAHDTIQMIQQDLIVFGIAVFFMFVFILSLIF